MPIIEIIYTVLKEYNNVFLNKLREKQEEQNFTSPDIMTPIATIIGQNQGLNLLLDGLDCISNKDRAKQELLGNY